MTNKTIPFLVGLWSPVLYFFVLTYLGAQVVGYNLVTTGMSELGAIDSPVRNWMNFAGFSLLGLSMMVFGGGLGNYFRRSGQLKVSAFLVFSAGLFMFLVGFLPCDHACVDVTNVGKLHSLTSTFPAILLPAAAMVAAYPLAQVWKGRWGYISFYLGLLSLTSGPLMFVAALTAYTGIIQRVGIGLSLIWMMVVSGKVLSTLKKP